MSPTLHFTGTWSYSRWKKQVKVCVYVCVCVCVWVGACMRQEGIFFSAVYSFVIDDFTTSIQMFESTSV